MFHNPLSPVIDPFTDTLQQEFAEWAAQHYPELTLNTSFPLSCMCFAMSEDECICPPASIDNANLPTSSSSSAIYPIKEECDVDSNLSPVIIKKEELSENKSEAAPSCNDVPGLLESLVNPVVKSERVKRERRITYKPVFVINENDPDVISYRAGLFSKRFKPDLYNPITTKQYRGEALASFTMKKRVGIFHFFHSFKKRYNCRSEFANNRGRNDNGKWCCKK
jgi:hypothetical protein